MIHIFCCLIFVDIRIITMLVYMQLRSGSGIHSHIHPTIIGSIPKAASEHHTNPSVKRVVHNMVRILISVLQANSVQLNAFLIEYSGGDRDIIGGDCMCYSSGHMFWSNLDAFIFLQSNTKEPLQSILFYY